MSDEYTPTTEQVRAGYASDPVGEYHDPINAASNERALGRAFDRWLAAHDREVQAAALREFADDEYRESERILAEMPDAFSGLTKERHNARNDAATRKANAVRARARAAQIEGENLRGGEGE